MNLTPIEENGVVIIAGPPATPLMATAGDVDRIVEACFATGAHSALLYADNLPPAFFDLSSGVAGVVLQKLRTYRIRLAVICPRGSVAFSSRFGEMVADERRGTHFGLFDTRQEASDWLQQPSDGEQIR